MRFVSADTETFLISPGNLAPPLVCLSYAERVAGLLQTGLLDHVKGVQFFRALLEDPEVTLVFHNAAFDLAVLATEDPTLMPLIFSELAAGRITDTMIREMLIMIAKGDMGFQKVRVEKDPEAEEDEDADRDAEEDTGESKLWRRMKKNYSLAGLSDHYLRRKLDKGEDDGDAAIRLTYDRFRGVPIEAWEPNRVFYALEDASTALEVFEKQAPAQNPAKYVSPDERMQVCASFALHLCAVRGVRTDPVALEKLESKLTTMQSGLGEKLKNVGLLRPKKTKGVVSFAKNMKAIRALVVSEYQRLKQPVPLTKKGLEAQAAKLPIDPEKHVSTSKDTIEAAASFPYPDAELVKPDDRSMWLAATCTEEEFEAFVDAHPAAALEPLVAYSNCQKIVGTYLKPMKAAADANIPMISRPNVLVETGRISWGAMTLKINGVKIKVGSNLTNFPRMPGVRDCVIPRPGFVLSSTDYDSIELRTLAGAQLKICGRSTSAERYQKWPDYDPHTAFACRLLSISYEEGMRRKEFGDKEIKRLRQFGKICNFGLSGGMSAKKLVLYAWKGYGIRISPSEADFYKQVWLQENPEMKGYLAFISHKVEAAGEKGATFTAYGTGRKRGGCFFTDGANFFFQSAAADGGKLALFAVSRECYCDPTSPLWGSRPLVFVHDELIVEIPEDKGHEASARIVEIMEREMSRIIPAIPVRASPTLMRRWVKSAEAAYNENGRLICWEDRIEKRKAA